MSTKVYDTKEQPCQILAGETSRILIYYYQPASQNISDKEYNNRNRAYKLARIKAGYYNQTEGAAKFACPSCRKCFSAAVKINDYKPNKGQRKTLRTNEDVEFSITEPYATRDLYDLFMSYMRQRHPESNMMNLSFVQFREKTLAHSDMALLKLNGEIVGCSWIDMDEEIIVGDYCFYNVGESQKRRLGGLMDLKLLEYATNKNIPFVSFGPINDESPKVKHKSQYRGTHIFDNNEWVPYQKPRPT